MAEEFTSEPGATGLGSAREYFDSLLKYSWLVILLGALGGAAGVYYADSQPPVFQASATIVVDASSSDILSDVDPVVETGGQSLWAQREYMETQLRILRSSSIASEVASQLGLSHDAEFLGLAGLPDHELEAALSAVDPAGAVQASLTIAPVPDSRVVTINARAPRAGLAAELANKTAEVYIARNMDRQLESTQSAGRWLDEQYQSLRAGLEQSERALVEFRQRENIIAVELEQNLSLSSRMEATSSQLAQARLDADQARAVVAQIDVALAENADITRSDVPFLTDNELIQTLKTALFTVESERIALSSRYLPGHPQMQAVLEREALARERLTEEIGNVIASLRQLSERSTALVRTLQGRLAEVESEVQRLGTHQVEYAALVRDAEANRALFDLIERRKKEVELTLNSLRNNVELLESAAMPTAAVSPNKRLIVAIASFGGLALGVLLALGLGMADDTVRSQTMLEKRFGLTFLGLLPSIRPSLTARPSKRGPARGEKWSPDTYVHDYPRSPVAEACRSIRTNLTFLATEAPLRALLVTSAGPRDGKTTSSLSLATVMAQAGTRIVVVDGDMRKPRLHGVLAGGRNDRGLSDLLTGQATIDDCVLTTPIPHIDFIPSGPIPPNPAELLESDAFRNLVVELTRRYDRVLIDSPPVNPVTDAAIIASVVDGVVLVVRAFGTRAGMLARAVEALSAVDANVLGAVLNDVDLQRRKGGYYYYYRQYAEYYGERDDTKDAA